MIIDFIEEGFKIWEECSIHQNNHYDNCNTILPSSKLWQLYLNKWSSYEWACIVIALEETLEIKPDLFEPYHIDTIESMKKVLLNDNDPMALFKNHKKLIWKMIMIMREIWNKMNNIKIFTAVLTSDQ